MLREVDMKLLAPVLFLSLAGVFTLSATTSLADTISADAYGTSVDIGPVVVPPTSESSGGPTNGSFSNNNSLVSQSTTILTASALSSSVTGNTSPTDTADATATVAQFDATVMMVGLSASNIVADASFAGGVFSGSASLTNGDFDGMMFNGPLTPNTMISLPGIGILILDEQILTGTSLIVNAIDLKLDPSLDLGTGFIVDHTEVAVDPTPEPQTWLLMLLGTVAMLFYGRKYLKAPQRAV